MLPAENTGILKMNTGILELRYTFEKSSFEIGGGMTQVLNEVFSEVYREYGDFENEYGISEDFRIYVHI